MEKLSSGESLTDQAHERIRHAIVTGELKPGSLHSIYRLADQLDVSRTPVREALVKLEEQGMIAFERNRGVRILEHSSRDLEEIFSIRLLLEVPATRRAVRRLDAGTLAHLRNAIQDMSEAASRGEEATMMQHDRRFHSLILETAGNSRLTRIVNDLRDLIAFRGMSTAGRSRTLDDIVSEHQSILDSLVRGEADTAAAEMRSHLRHTAQLLLSQEADADPRTAGIAWFDDDVPPAA